MKRTVWKSAIALFVCALFVLTGCTAGIIGDDIASVTNEFLEKGIPVYPIETPGFTGDSNLGYETVWNTFLDKVIEKDVPLLKQEIGAKAGLL